MEILERIKNKKIVPRYLKLTFALLITAISYNLLLQPFNLVTGGTNGVAVILNHVFNMNSALVIFSLSMILTSLSFFFLDTDYSISMIYIAIVYPIFVHLTAFVPDLINLNTNDLLIVSIFGGVISGVANGIIYKNGLSSGGFNVIAKILYEYKHISISLTNTIMNSIIVIIGGFFVGFNIVLYAIIYIYITQIITDRIMIGVSKDKTIYIVSEHSDEINDALINEFGHSTTMFNTKGGKENKKAKTIMTVIPTKEYYAFKSKINEIDKKAFMVAVDSYEVKGGK